MSTASYDVITVGGGLGGSALAAAMARRGARVLVLEREQSFSDRVRGEALAPWGIAELRRLGLHELVQRACGHELPWFDLYYLGAMVNHRDVPATTPQAVGWLAFFHPAMQELVLNEAREAGAEVRRGVRVRGVQAGASPTVTAETDDGAEELSARLVVGADGRGSLVRRWCGFEVQKAEPRHLFSGVLFDHLDADERTSSLFLDPQRGRIALLFPQGGGRVRAYVGFHRHCDPPRASEYGVDRFIDESVRTGVPSVHYDRALPAGPLAMFDATDNWVEAPYRDGVALIGDAAATSDPTWGQGMSLTLRDVRTLSDCLAATDDWDAAGRAYAEEHRRYYGVVRQADDWFAELFMGVGPEAEQRRMAALPLIAEDPTRIVDVPMAGPDLPVDEQSRRRFFGEE